MEEVGDEEEKGEKEWEEGIFIKTENRPGAKALESEIAKLANWKLSTTCHQVTADSAKALRNYAQRHWEPKRNDTSRAQRNW